MCGHAHTRLSPFHEAGKPLQRQQGSDVPLLSFRPVQKASLLSFLYQSREKEHPGRWKDDKGAKMFSMEARKHSCTWHRKRTAGLCCSKDAWMPLRDRVPPASTSRLTTLPAKRGRGVVMPMGAGFGLPFSWQTELCHKCTMAPTSISCCQVSHTLAPDSVVSNHDCLTRLKHVCNRRLHTYHFNV